MVLDSKNQTSKSSIQGFTLVEMIVVVVIIAIIAVIALPKIQSIAKISLDTGVREMAGIIKDAYNATMVTGHVHRLVYDIEKNTYWIERGPKEYASLE